MSDNNNWMNWNIHGYTTQDLSELAAKNDTLLIDEIKQAINFRYIESQYYIDNLDFPIDYNSFLGDVLNEIKKLNYYIAQTKNVTLLKFGTLWVTTSLTRKKAKDGLKRLTILKDLVTNKMIGG